MKGIKVVVLLSALLCFLGKLQAQEVIFQKVGVKNGLSNNNIRTILQDKDSLMWIATANGLNSFDGRQFKEYSPKNKYYEFSILNILEVGDTLWLGMYNDGLYLYNKLLNQFTHQSKVPYLAGVMKDVVYISSLAYSQKTIWAAGADRYGNMILVKIEPQKSKAKVFNQFNKLNNIYEREEASVLVHQDTKGKEKIWLGGIEGLYEFDPENETFKSYVVKKTSKPEVLDDNTVKCLAWRKNKRQVLVGTNRGLRIFDLVTKIFTDFKIEEIDKEEVRCVFETPLEIWIGTRSGLFAYHTLTNKTRKYQYQLSNPLTISNNSINSIQEIKQTLWIGTAGGGINLLSLKTPTFTAFTPTAGKENGLQSVATTAMIDAPSQGKNFAWIATYNGLHLFNTKTQEFQVFKRKGNEDNNIFYSLAEVKDKVWIGTVRGLCYFDIKTQTFTNLCIDSLHDLSKKSIHSLVQSSSLNDTDVLWAATLRGLYKIEINYTNNKPTCRITEIVPQESFSKLLITKEKGKETLWGATNNGLMEIDLQSHRTHLYKHDPNSINSLSANRITALTKSDEQTLWLSYSINGMTKFDIKHKQFKHYKIENGLPHEMVYSMQAIDSNNLWITNGAGLSHLSIPNDAMENFSETIGIPMDEFDGSLYYKDADGKLYFSRDKGIIAFHPDSIVDEPIFPKVMLTSIKILGKDLELDTMINYKKKIVLPHYQNNISLEFSALYYYDNGKIKYAYKLEGLENEWVVSDSRNFVNYTDLAPNRYIFKIRASNNNRSLGTNLATLEIVILPPFWARWWFVSIVILILSSISYVSFKAWVRKVTDNQLELERLVEQRTQEIKKQKEQIEEKQKEINKQYGTLMEQQAELVLSNATKNRLLSVVSDDVGNALNILKLQLDSLDSRVKNIESKEIKSIIEEMGKNLKHTAVLLQNLLHWSLEQLHHANPFFVTINLWQIVEENIEFFKALARSKSITLDNQIPKEIEVLADINILNLTIRDLFSTTIKFTTEGFVSISAEIKDDNIISIAVHSSESNLTNEQIINFLSKFNEESFSLTNYEKSPSLGLRTAKDYISKMGGQLTITSQGDKGFVINFTLHKAQ